MKYAKERKLAKEVLLNKLGYAPSLENIIPLESEHNHGICNYVLFTIRGGNANVQYRAGTSFLVMEQLDSEGNSVKEVQF